MGRVEHKAADGEREVGVTLKVRRPLWRVERCGCLASVTVASDRVCM